LVVVKYGKAVTSSLEMAARFEKGHKHVLENVEGSGCSTEFQSAHFWADYYTDKRGRKQPMYWMDRDGFTFVAMSFTGKKAAQFKERYIAAFNAMEKKLMGDMREMLSKEDGMKMSDPAEENSPTLAKKLASSKLRKV